MTLQTDTTFELNGVKTNMRMKVSGSTTLSVLAKVQKRPTRNRNPPPECGNGFETAYLPFAKGHIVALELGGSDNKYNVVPQFEMWQGNGPWRAMEKLVHSTVGDMLMLVEITYGRPGPGQNLQGSIEAFQDNNFIDWTDKRIPSGFDVTIFKSSANLTTISCEGLYDAAVASLKSGSAPRVTTSFDLGTKKMPEPDHHAYVVQAALTIAKPRLQRSTSFATLFMVEGEMGKVRDQLKLVSGISATDANNVHAGPMIMAGQKITKTALKKKRKQREIGGLMMADEDEVFPG